MNRNLPLVLLLTGAVGVPFGMSQLSDTPGEATDEAAAPATAYAEPGLEQSWAGSADGGRYASEGAADRYALPGPGPQVPQQPIAPSAPAAVSLEEALRLDLSVAGVLGRWPRISTGLANLDLQGYRTAWSSGPAIDDVAGSLTYYFNQRQRIASIHFQGTTGDSRRLVALLSQRFGFRRVIHPDPALHVYQVRWNGKARSELQIRSAPIVRADQPHARFYVTLMISNPDVF